MFFHIFLEGTGCGGDYGDSFFVVSPLSPVTVEQLRTVFANRNAPSNFLIRVPKTLRCGFAPKEL